MNVSLARWEFADRAGSAEAKATAVVLRDVAVQAEDRALHLERGAIAEARADLALARDEHEQAEAYLEDAVRIYATYGYTAEAEAVTARLS